ncbi:MAG: hypothetical protein ACTSXJ_11350 [Candidatus Baldrarchaeia archaeon]
MADALGVEKPELKVLSYGFRISKKNKILYCDISLSLNGAKMEISSEYDSVTDTTVWTLKFPPHYNINGMGKLNYELFGKLDIHLRVVEAKSPLSEKESNTLERLDYFIERLLRYVRDNLIVGRIFLLTVLTLRHFCCN